MQMMLRGTIVFTICLAISMTANVCRGAADGQTAEIGANALGTVEIADEKINRKNYMLENAGRFIDRHTMVWMRKLDVPVARVWEAVSTKQGLEEWWMGRSVEIDLRPGGAFSHHWESTITDYRENEYINFGGMRFELKADGETTVFSFIDNWAQDAVPGETMLPSEADEIDRHQPGGPGTPWSGMAAGWHGMIDALETYLTGKTLDYSWEDGCRFYADYLTNHFRWQELMAPKQESPTMIGVKQDVAADFSGSSTQTPMFTGIIPVLGITSYEEAVAHYVDWLGFNLDWEWREAPSRPVIMAISRDDVAFMLNEYPSAPRSFEVHIKVSNLENLAAEWNANRPGKFVGWAYTDRITDAFGNTLVFERNISKEEKEARQTYITKMRIYVQQQLDEGKPFPTPEEMASDVTGEKEIAGNPSQPFIDAVDVLNAFPGYGEVYNERRKETFKNLELAVVTLTKQSVLVIERKTSLVDIPANVTDITPRVLSHISERGYAPAGPAFLRILDITEGQAVIEVGWPVEKKVAGSGDIKYRELPGGKAVTALNTGPNEQVSDIWHIVIDYASEHGYRHDSSWGGSGGWQVFLNDSTVVGSNKTQSRLYLPLSK